MNIDRILSYNAPEGTYRTRVISAEVTLDFKGEKVRINYELISHHSVTKEYRVGHNFRPQDADELIAVLEILTRGNPEMVIARDGKINEVALQKLAGSECDVRVVHIHSKSSKHANPYCKIVQVTAPGELVDYSEETQQ